MPIGIRCGLVALCAFLATQRPTNAATDSFADLLSRAKVQAAEGHRWAPPGDNMSETIMAMLDAVNSATPEQLAEVSALLEHDRPAAGQIAASGQTAGGQATPADSVLLVPLAAPRSAATAPIAVPTTQAVPRLAAAESPAMPIVPAKAKQQGFEQPAPRELVPSQTTADPARAGMLFARGLDAEHRGDLSAARRFYATAARNGDAAAARNLGRLYDAGYLKRTALGGVDPDQELARFWYDYAVRLGDTGAGPLLEALSSR